MITLTRSSDPLGGAEMGSSSKASDPNLERTHTQKHFTARVAYSRIAFWVFVKTEGVPPFRKLKQFLI